MKRLAAAVLLMILLGTAAMAEITVEVDGVNGVECYTAIRTDDLSLRFDQTKWCYRTEDGLIWQADPIAFPKLEPLLMPQNKEEIRAMNGLYAALEDASGFWNVETAGEGRLPVHTAPDRNALRGADGKAAVELSGGVRLLMDWDGWSLVEYRISRDAHRIGWVPTNRLGVAPVLLTDIAVTLKPDAFLTDDPISSWRHVAEADALKKVHLLAKLDAFWGYVRAEMPDGQMVWGFVPLRSMVREDTVDQAMMEKLAGDWGFAGGGELMAELFTLSADGIITYWRLPEEDMLRQAWMTESLAGKETTVISQHTWQIVSGTAGYEYDLLLTGSTGRVERLHAIYNEEEQILSLTQGEAGGSWQRLEK